MAAHSHGDALPILKRLLSAKPVINRASKDGGQTFESTLKGTERLWTNFEKMRIPEVSHRKKDTLQMTVFCT